MPSLALAGPSMHIRLAAHPNLKRQVLASPQKLVCIEDLLPPGFIRRHSQFRDVTHMLTASRLGSEALVSLVSAESSARTLWDNFIRLSTTFPNWTAMLREARGEWIMRRIGIHIDA
jgi:hypothetical protein